MLTTKEKAMIMFANEQNYNEPETVEQYLEEIEELTSVKQIYEIDQKEEYRDIVKWIDIDFDGDSFSFDSQDWLCYTYQEAGWAEDEYLDNYIDECIMPSLPKDLQFYFDDEKWKKDARMDGRGHCLASYDGEEHEIEVDNETFYFYRVN